MNSSIQRLTGINIKLIREDIKLTQHQLSVQADVRESYISKLENDKIPNPKISNLLKLSGALGCDISNFFEFVEA